MIKKNKQQLKQEAICFLKKDNELCLVVAVELGIELFSLPSMISRKSRRLTELNVVSKIAERMGKPANELIETAA